VLSENDPLRQEKADLQARFEQAMDDDFNTPVALGVLFDLKRELQRYNHAETRNARHFALGVAKLVQLSQVLGLELHPMAPLAVPSHLRKEIDTLLAQRDAARTRKDWKEADRLREELRTMGVTVEDTPDGSHSRWEPAGH
jgi:cysteinyl-tRNA synthetase